jgi:hypothetical protein
MKTQITLQDWVGKTIQSAEFVVDDPYGKDRVVVLKFTDGSSVKMYAARDEDDVFAGMFFYKVETKYGKN